MCASSAHPQPMQWPQPIAHGRSCHSPTIKSDRTPSLHPLTQYKLSTTVCLKYCGGYDRLHTRAEVCQHYTILQSSPVIVLSVLVSRCSAIFCCALHYSVLICIKSYDSLWSRQGERNVSSRSGRRLRTSNSQTYE